MINLTNLMRLRILGHTFCSDLEFTFDHFDEARDTNAKWQKVLLAIIKPQSYGWKARPKYFAPEPWHDENGQTPGSASGGITNLAFPLCGELLPSTGPTV